MTDGRSTFKNILALLLPCVVIGCAGTPPPDDDEISIPLTDTTVTAKAPPPIETAAPGEISQETKDQIKVALRRGGEKSAQCNKAANANVVGEGTVDVLVDGKIGKVIDATVGAPFAGTAVEECIKRAFINEYALPFEGQLTIPYSITLTANTAAPKKDPKKK